MRRSARCAHRFAPNAMNASRAACHSIRAPRCCRHGDGRRRAPCVRRRSRTGRRCRPMSRSLLHTVDRLGEIAVDQCRPGPGERSARIDGSAVVRGRDRRQLVGGAASRVDVTGGGGDLGLGVEQRGQPQVAERWAFLRWGGERMSDRLRDEGRMPSRRHPAPIATRPVRDGATRRARQRRRTPLRPRPDRPCVTGWCRAPPAASRTRGASTVAVPHMP